MFHHNDVPEKQDRLFQFNKTSLAKINIFLFTTVVNFRKTQFKKVSVKEHSKVIKYFLIQGSLSMLTIDMFSQLKEKHS